MSSLTNYNQIEHYYKVYLQQSNITCHLVQHCITNVKLFSCPANNAVSSAEKPSKVFIKCQWYTHKGPCYFIPICSGQSWKRKLMTLVNINSFSEHSAYLYRKQNITIILVKAVKLYIYIYRGNKFQNFYLRLGQQIG